MALSDEERRYLEKLEQELAATDPDLDRQLQAGGWRKWESRRIIWGVLATFVGFGVLIAGIVTQLPAIGVAGFLLMVAGAILFDRGLHKGT